MPVLSKGVTFASGDQVNATNLNNLVDQATFVSGAVDGSTTQLSGGAIIVKDGGITPAKLSSGGPTWAGNILTITQGLNVGNDAQPGVPVNISGGSTGPALTFKREGTSCGSIKFDNNTYEFDSTTSQPIVFKVNGTEGARVTATGINSTPVGATTVSTGAFSTLSATGLLSLGNDISLDRGSPGAALSWAHNARLIVPSSRTFTFSADGGSTSHATVTSTGINSTAIGATTASTGRFTTLNLTTLPTSASGLSAGDVWNNGGVLTIVT